MVSKCQELTDCSSNLCANIDAACAKLVVWKTTTEIRVGRHEAIDGLPRGASNLLGVNPHILLAKTVT